MSAATCGVTNREVSINPALSSRISLRSSGLLATTAPPCAGVLRPMHFRSIKSAAARLCCAFAHGILRTRRGTAPVAHPGLVSHEHDRPRPTHPDSGGSAGAADAVAAGGSQRPHHGRAGVDRARRSLLCRQSRDRCAGRGRRGVSRPDADADAGGRRHGRRRVVGDRAGARLRAAR
jgi:hypothetical protein